MRNSLDKTCYLHIGTHKTGSTSIQKFLIDSHEALRLRGVILPSISKSPIDQDHKILANALTRFRIHKGDVEPLHQLSALLQSSASDVIISAETLSQKLGAGGEFAALKDYFKSHGYRLHVILYLRDQLDFMNSLYVQGVKRFKYFGSFESYLKEVVADSHSHFDYLHQYGFLMDDPEITFSPRSFAVAVRDGLILDFLSTIPPLAGMSAVDDPATSTIQNPNAGTKSVFVARMVASGADESYSIADLSKLSPLLKKIYMDRKWYEDPFIGLDQDSARLIEQKFLSSNDKFSRKYWACDWRDLNPPLHWERRVFSYADASPHDKRDVIGATKLLLAKLGRKPVGRYRSGLGRLWNFFKS
jgi:hypothetical protein